MYGITLSDSTIENLASKTLDVDRDIDMGPAPNGGRYYVTLTEGLADLVDDSELGYVVEDAIRDYFQNRKAELRAGLARWLRDVRQDAKES